jgi:hypothetical protein
MGKLLVEKWSLRAVRSACSTICQARTKSSASDVTSLLRCVVLYDQIIQLIAFKCLHARQAQKNFPLKFSNVLSVTLILIVCHSLIN